MGTWSRVSLVAVVAALVAAVALVALAGLRLRGRELAAGGERGSAVVEVAPEEVRSVWVSEGGAEARLEREGSGWVRTAPPDGPGDAAAVAGLVEAAAALRRRTTLGRAGELGGEFDAYGLRHPRAALELELVSGRSLRLELGAATGTDGAAFVRAPDGEVVVVGSDRFEQLEVAIRGILLAPRPHPPGGAPPPTGGSPGG